MTVFSNILHYCDLFRSYADLQADFLDLMVPSFYNILDTRHNILRSRYQLWTGYLALDIGNSHNLETFAFSNHWLTFYLYKFILNLVLIYSEFLVLYKVLGTQLILKLEYRKQQKLDSQTQTWESIFANL